ncbi:hypothetical protein LWI28_017186 [Acer negundo]|uniref:Cytochrome P450 n=1 Tax=Acer negundo TaxID=4023 RepID=A0AAD5IQJ3_ACENE|nr:hypothetical protein LWI28_017186 [Acer negundo]
MKPRLGYSNVTLEEVVTSTSTVTDANANANAISQSKAGCEMIFFVLSFYRFIILSFLPLKSKPSTHSNWQIKDSDNDQRLADRCRNRRLTLSFKNGQDLVWADYGSHYVKVSKVCTLELFSPKSIEALRPIREDEVRNMIESIYKDLNNPDHQNYGDGGGRGGLVLREYLGSVAFNNITRVVFGKKFVSKQGVMNESDISNLPYLQCIVKEAMRLHPSTPLMLPHRANSHIKISGYNIPKGTVVHFNIWAIARDPSIWDDPLEFKPDRFVNNDVDIKGRQDFRMLPFGAGRRICPGAQLGVNLVTSMIGHMLHHFEWTQPEAVRLDEIDMSKSPGLACYMLTPLQAVPTPRLPAHLHKCETWDC